MISILARMLTSRNGSLQLGVFVTRLVTAIQLSFDGVDLVLLPRIFPVMNEHGLSFSGLSIRGLSVELAPALLQPGGRPFAEGRVRARMISRSGKRDRGRRGDVFRGGLLFGGS